MAVVLAAVMVVALVLARVLEPSSSSPARTLIGSPAWSAPRSARVRTTVARTRLMNYFPADHPQQGMWWNWDPVAIDRGMLHMEALGANTVRLIVFPGTFGFPISSPRYTAELRQAVAMAAAHGLRVVLSLFGAWGSYADLTGSEKWAASLLAPYRGDPEVAYVELQNEIDPGNLLAMSWARTMLPHVRVDAQRPVSVSVTGWDSANHLAELIQRLGSNQPDIYDYHFYGPLQHARSIFAAVKHIAAGRPIIIGETGYSTAVSNTSQPGVTPSVSAHEAFQSHFYSVVERTARRADLPPAAPWILSDFPPAPTINSVEQHFGLYRLNGTAKPAAATVRSAFLAAARRSTAR
jgi:hypothetical protein